MTLDDLTKLRSAIPDDGALAVSTTQAELDAIRQRRRLLDNRLMAARNATATLASLPEADTQWFDHLNAWRQTLSDELEAIPDRILTDHELGMRQNLTISIRCIDFGLSALTDSVYDLTTLRLGTLMRQTGYEPRGADPRVNYMGAMPWFGSFQEVEHDRAIREARRAEAQAQLDDALLDDEARAKLEAEAQARRDALNALPTRKVRGDGSVYDKYPSGERVEVTS